MIYKIHFGGTNTVDLPLEELAARRRDGRLTGRELVWCPGMPQWQTLDCVLGASGLGVVHRMRGLYWSLAGAALLIVVICAGFEVSKFARTFSQGFAKGFAAAAGGRGAQIYNVADRGVDVARRPIAQTTNSLRLADLQKLRREFRVRNYVQEYELKGLHDQPWDADARLFFKSWLNEAYDERANTNLPGASSLASQLAANPDCHDPIVLTVAAADCPEYYEKVNRLERAVAAFTNSNYKAYPRFFATVQLADELNRDTVRVAALDRAALDLLRECFRDGSIQPKDQWDFGDNLIDTWGAHFTRRHAKQVQSIVTGAGPDFRWLARLLEGEREINLAWKSRGGGYADSVTADGWKGFQEHLVRASAALTEAWNLHPEWGTPAANMETVSMGLQDEEQVRLWFDRATTSVIDHAGAWKEFRWTLRPRWYGSLSALEALGISAIDSGRFDSDVPRQFFDCVSDIEEELGVKYCDHIYGRSDIWPQMKRMYSGYINDPSQLESQKGWRQTYAVVAYLAKHYDVAREQLEKTDWKLDLNHTEEWGQDLYLLPLEVAARTGPHARQIAGAEADFQRGDVDEALREYRSISSPDDVRTEQFVAHRIAALQCEQQLATGEWMDFLPTATNDLTWTTSLGHLKILPGNQVEIDSGPEGSMAISHVRVGPNFEIRGNIEVVKSSNGDFQAGVIMGMPETSAYNWFCFRLKRNRHEGEGYGYSSGFGWSAIPHVNLHETTNSFDFVLHNKCQADISINGEKVFLHHARPADIRVFDNQFLLGLGAYNDMNETTIRYSHVQVRRLNDSNSKSTKGLASF